MPKTSAASLRRKARGIGDKPVDPALSEKRRAAATKRWAKERGQDPAKIEQARAAAKVGNAPALNRGGEMRHTAAYVQNLNQRLGVARMQVHAKAVDGAGEAVDYLLRLVRGVGDCEDAPHNVRRLAAGDILGLAGVAMGQGPAGAGLADKPITEWTVGDLQAQIANLESELCAQVIEGEASSV